MSTDVDRSCVQIRAQWRDGMLLRWQHTPILSTLVFRTDLKLAAN